MAHDPLADYIIQRQEKLRGDRAGYDSLWLSIKHYVLPTQGTFQEQVAAGTERTRHILDSTAPMALEHFASFLHTTMNNPARVWIKLGEQSDEASSQLMKEWFEYAARRVHTLIAGHQTSVYANLHRIWLHLGAYGTGVLYVEYFKGKLYTRTYMLDDVDLEEDQFGKVDTVYLSTEYTLRQAKQKWPGANLGIRLEQQWANEIKSGTVEARKYKFIHAVGPMDDARISQFLEAYATPESKIANLPFYSCWVNVEDRTVVATGGYEEFPFMVPRWTSVTNEVYGRSPAMTALPDIRMANRMTETILRGAEKLVDPSVILPEGSIVSPLRFFPGGVNYSDGPVKPEFLTPPGASRIELGEALLRNKQESIRQAFFVPLFITPDSPVKTATQVLEQVDERNKIVSPMLIRLQEELFHGFVKRVLGLGVRQGDIKPPPEKVRGPLQIEYISPLTSSQHQIEGLGLVRLMEILAPWAGSDPGILDNYDPDRVAQVAHNASGAPQDIMRLPHKVRELREARSKMRQQEQQQQLALEAGSVQAELIKARGSA